MTDRRMIPAFTTRTKYTATMKCSMSKSSKRCFLVLTDQDSLDDKGHNTLDCIMANLLEGFYVRFTEGRHLVVDATTYHYELDPSFIYYSRVL